MKITQCECASNSDEKEGNVANDLFGRNGGLGVAREDSRDGVEWRKCCAVQSEEDKEVLHHKSKERSSDEKQIKKNQTRKEKYTRKGKEEMDEDKAGSTISNKTAEHDATLLLPIIPTPNPGEAGGSQLFAPYLTAEVGSFHQFAPGNASALENRQQLENRLFDVCSFMHAFFYTTQGVDICSRLSRCCPVSVCVCVCLRPS